MFKFDSQTYDFGDWLMGKEGWCRESEGVPQNELRHLRYPYRAGEKAVQILLGEREALTDLLIRG